MNDLAVRVTVSVGQYPLRPACRSISHWPSVGVMVAQRLRRWPSISQAQGQGLALDEYRFMSRVRACRDCPRVASQQTPDIEPRLVQCWAGIVDGGPTLNQHWLHNSFLLPLSRCLVYRSWCDPRLVGCWHTVCDTRPKLKRYWFNIVFHTIGVNMTCKCAIYTSPSALSSRVVLCSSHWG